MQSINTETSFQHLQPPGEYKLKLLCNVLKLQPEWLENNDNRRTDLLRRHSSPHGSPNVQRALSKGQFCSVSTPPELATLLLKFTTVQILMTMVRKTHIAFIELFILNYYRKLKKIISKVNTVIMLFYPLQNLILGLLEKQLIFY